jgi:hypothetical protein
MINKKIIELKTNMLPVNFLKFKFPKLILLFPCCIIHDSKFVYIVAKTCT